MLLEKNNQAIGQYHGRLLVKTTKQLFLLENPAVMTYIAFVNKLFLAQAESYLYFRIFQRIFDQQNKIY